MQADRIFLLSHMRAFSSLIGHILGSHVQINGYYEMHISYLNNDNLLEQEDLYQQQEPFKPGSHYLFDKLLHNAYELDLQSLNLDQPKILLAIRSPENSIKSIINLFKQKNQSHRFAEPDQATEYYIQRLQKLSEFCLKNSKAYFYFDAELMLSSPRQMLAAITHWLQLNSPLNSQYQTFSNTGKPRAGDSSSSIKSGKIIKTANNYSAIELPKELFNLAEKAYARNREILINHAIEHRACIPTQEQWEQGIRRKL